LIKKSISRNENQGQPKLKIKQEVSCFMIEKKKKCNFINKKFS